MNPIPLITGLGLATPLSADVVGTWVRLLEGAFIRDHARIPLEADDGPRVTQLALHVAREAMAGARWQRGGEAAVVVGTSKGPVEAWMTTASEHVPFGLGQIATTLAQALDLRGPRLTLSAACASGLHALVRGAMMIMGGEARRVLVVASESSLHPLFLGSFKRLGVLAREGEGCRPFDQNRRGFLMSEAAAAVCLEATEGTSATPIARVDRFALGGDATHLTGSDPTGATLRHLLRRVVDQQRPVNLFHAHATGTKINDPVELDAIESVLPDQDGPRPSLYSHKGAIGHSLGAAGLTSIVINALCHRDGIVPPNIQTPDPLPMKRVTLSREPVQRRIDRSVTMASGFGGPIAVVSLVRA